MAGREPGAGARPLAGRVALVTGAASGIGAATARAFAEAGAAVALLDVDRAGGESLAREITGRGGRALFLEGDVSRSGDCRSAVDRTVEVLGGLDILFNCAGIIERGTVIETEERDWDRLMDVNVKSIFLLSKHAIPVMAGSGGGVIINVASGWGLVGGRRAAAYCASKGAVVQLSRAMALDHGEQNIRVNCICPGDTDSPMLRREAEQLGVPMETFLAEASARPLPGLVRPEDIAAASVFLAGDASSSITGACLVIDRGGLAGSG